MNEFTMPFGKHKGEALYENVTFIDTALMNTWNCLNKEGVYLGALYYCSQDRKYMFSVDNEIELSGEVIVDIADFLRQLNEQGDLG